MLPLRRNARRRALLAACAIVVAIAVVGTGQSPDARALQPVTSAEYGSEEVATAPQPAQPASSTDEPTPEPTPSAPASPTPAPSVPTTEPPAPSSPTPTPGSSASPARPPAAPTIPVPLTPAAPGVTQPPSGPTTTHLPTATALAPAGFGRVYPTHPWIYNAAPGTRYLDDRESSNGRVTRRHMGIDSQGAPRQPIFAAADGVVIDGTWGTTARDGHGYGNSVQIAHSEGYTTRYAHFAEAPSVRVGDRVSAGQLLGVMGGSQRGDLTRLPRHLHFEVTKDGKFIDPLVFLDGAGDSGVADTPPANASSAVGAPEPFLLREVRPTPGGGLASISTGITTGGDVFTAVDDGGATARLFISEHGTLTSVAVIDSAWAKTDTGVPLSATSMSGGVGATGLVEIFAIEDGKLYHLADTGAGWVKTWTGHLFTGTVSAVALPDGRMHAMLQQSGYVYHLSPAQSGLWNINDTGLRVDGAVDAVYLAGAYPDAVALSDGMIVRLTRGEVTWESRPTGLTGYEALAAIADDAGWPVVFSSQPGEVSVSRVVERLWRGFVHPVDAPGPLDAVAARDGIILYSLG